MRTVGSFHAKTHLSELLNAASRGETILITKNGRPQAKLVPAEDVSIRHQDIVAGFVQLRSEIGKGTPSIRELIEEGRRY